MASQDSYIELSSLPEEVRRQVQEFIRALMEQWEKRKRDQEPGNGGGGKMRRFGIAKGMATMAEDFDAPLDDFKEYME